MPSTTIIEATEKTVTTENITVAKARISAC
jgi:hypothetical protein